LNHEPDSFAFAVLGKDANLLGLKRAQAEKPFPTAIECAVQKKWASY
jgi:hypothetical protein